VLRQFVQGGYDRMNDKEEAKHLTARAEALTGEWYCQSGHHRVKGGSRLHRGKRICELCHKRISEARKLKGVTE
jgi:hypothetical protein